jgi:hypothetical protein
VEAADLGLAFELAAVVALDLGVVVFVPGPDALATGVPVPGCACGFG